VYQQPDSASVLAVMNETRKLGDRGLTSATAGEMETEETQQKTSQA
jgi:hypothetical protein